MVTSGAGTSWRYREGIECGELHRRHHRHARYHCRSHRQPSAGKGREHLAKVAEQHGLSLRHNYNHVAPRPAEQICHYAHANQFNRMQQPVRTLRTRMGPVQREVTRQLYKLPEKAPAMVPDLLGCTSRILAQSTKDRNKPYVLFAPEVECLAKRKARTPYEFSVKM
jgi:IS5 family transposase